MDRDAALPPKHLQRMLMSGVSDEASDIELMGVKLRDMDDTEIRAAALWLATQMKLGNRF